MTMPRAGFTRLILVTLLLFALASAGLVGLVLRWSQSSAVSQIDAETGAEISDLQAFYEQRRLLALKELVEERSSWRPSLGAVYLLAYNRSGERLGGDALRWPKEAVFDQPFEFALYDGLGNPAGVTVRARAVVLNGAFNLLIGRAIEPRMALAREFEKALPPLAAGIGLLGLAAALAIGRTMLRRLEAINAAARAVEAGDLEMRAPGAARADEFGDLARHMNRMLDRIGVLLATTRLAGDHIAHELRTPMTRLRARLEQAAGLAEGPARERIADAVEDTRSLSAIYDALLDISRIESRSGDAGGLEPLDLRAVIGEVAELYAPFAEDRGVRLDPAPGAPLMVRGDRVLLQRLAANLIDNALKFSPEGGAVMIRLSQRAGRFSLSVADEGPGMPAGFIARAFDRFSRAPQAEGKDGFGLGLAIVKAIAARHRFEISARNAAAGLIIEVTGEVAG